MSEELGPGSVDLVYFIVTLWQNNEVTSLHRGFLFKLLAEEDPIRTLKITENRLL